MAERYQDVIFTTDVGRHQIFAAHYLKPGTEGNFLTSGGLGTMGFGLPAAIGAAYGCRDKHVVVISGDGSFTMNCQEIATAADLGLKITVLVMNDTQLGMIHQLQDAFYGKRYQACRFDQTIDFAGVARAMGAQGETATTLEEVLTALERGSELEGPMIIDCRIPVGENVYPMVTGSTLTDFSEE